MVKFCRISLVLPFSYSLGAFPPSVVAKAVRDQVWSAIPKASSAYVTEEECLPLAKNAVLGRGKIGSVTGEAHKKKGLGRGPLLIS